MSGEENRGGIFIYQVMSRLQIERWTNDIDRSEKMKNIFFLTKKNERFQKNDRFLLNELFYQ